jgi:serine-type D-Ala-D-Ala carboxypeptidase/endopeptidase (penicillin-binding protein 4)
MRDAQPVRRRTTPALLLLALSVGACATAAPAPPGPPSVVAALAVSIDSIIDAPPLHRTTWGILVIEAATGSVLYARNAERHYIPASNMKLVVGAVALARLGPDFRYRTAFRVSGMEGGRVATLVAVGVGDPTWSPRFYPDRAAPFDSMAARVAESGVREVDELVVDVSRFRDERVHPTWEVDDLPGVFAPPVDAFAAAEGTFRLALMAGPAVGAAGSAEVLPPLHQPVRADVTTDTAGARASVRVDFTGRRDTIYLGGRVGLGATDTLTLAVTRPAESAALALADALRRRGVSVGAVRVVRDSAEAAATRGGTVEAAVLVSPPMREIVASLLRPSQNWIAEQVVKTLGAEVGEEGSWRGGQAVQRMYLYEAVGVDSGALVLRDASGMSAQNLLTPSATVALLAHARTQTWGSIYRDGLPKPGLTGSTLANRLRPLEGRVAAKTGTISNVNSLSGYFTDADGRDFIFSILSNGSGLPAAAVRTAIDDVMLALARHLDAR